MINIREVESLPVLDAERFPTLPSKFVGLFCVMRSENWDCVEKRVIASIILTAIARRGAWEPIPFEDFVAVMTEDAFNFSTLRLGEGSDYARSFLQKLAESGEIDFIKYSDKKFIVPLPAFADAIKASNTVYWKITSNVAEKVSLF